MKIMNYLTIAFTATNITILVWVGWLLFAPAPLPIVYNEPFPLDKTEVKRGDDISYFVHLKKTADYEATLNRNIICDDGNLVTLAPANSQLSIGERRMWQTFSVPAKTSLGKCYLQMNNAYKINPIRTEYLTLRTQEFNVIE